MAGVALAVQHGGHIAVEALLGLLGREGQRSVLLAGHALVVLAYVVLCWQALEVAEIVVHRAQPRPGPAADLRLLGDRRRLRLLALGTVTVAIRVALLGPEAMPQPSPEEMPT